MSSEAIKLGEAFVKIGANATELNQTLAGATDRIKDFGEQAMNVANSIAVGWGVCQAAIIGVTKHFAAVGDQLDKMAARTGVSSQTLSQWSYVAGQCGSSIEDVNASMVKMSKNIVNGSDKFSQLGLSVENLRNMSPEMQFLSVAQAISQMDNATEQAALATAVFGGSGEKLLPMLKQGTEGINALSESANQLGIVLDVSATTRAAAMTDAYDNLHKTISGLSITMGNVLAPVVIGITNSIAQHVGGIISWANAYSGILSGIASVVSVILKLTTGFLALYGTMKACVAISTTYIAIKGKLVSTLKNGISAIVSSYNAWRDKWVMLKYLKLTQGEYLAAVKYATMMNVKNASSTYMLAASIKVQTTAELSRMYATWLSTNAILANAAGQRVATVAGWGLAIATKAVANAYLLLTQISPMGWIMAAGAALVGLIAYFAGGESAATKYAQSMEKLREQNDNMRQTHELYAQRLEQLNKKEKLSTEEKEETSKIVSQLNEKYKDLGLQIDPLSGKVINAKGAIVSLREAMQQAAETDINNSIAALNEQLHELQSKEGTWGTWLAATFTFGYVDNSDEIKQKIEETAEKISKLTQEKTKKEIEKNQYSMEYANAENELNQLLDNDRRSELSDIGRQADDIDKEFQKREKLLKTLIDEAEAKENLTQKEEELLKQRKEMLNNLDDERDKRITQLYDDKDRKTRADLNAQLNKFDEKDEQDAQKDMSESEKKIAALRKECEERKKLLITYLKETQYRKNLSEEEKETQRKRLEQLKSLQTTYAARIEEIKKADEAQKETTKQSELASLNKSFNDRRQTEKDKALEQQWNDMAQRNPNNAAQTAQNNVAKLETATEDAYKKLEKMIQSGATDEEKKAQKDKIDMMENELTLWKNRRDDVTIGRLKNAQASTFSQPSIAEAGSLDAQRKFLENQQANKGNPMVKIGEEQVNWLEKIFNQQVNLNNNFSLEGV